METFDSSFRILAMILSVAGAVYPLLRKRLTWGFGLLTLAFALIGAMYWNYAGPHSPPSEALRIAIFSVAPLSLWVGSSLFHRWWKPRSK